MIIKKFLATLLGAITIAYTAITPVLAADATNSVSNGSIIASSSISSSERWTQSVPQTNESSDSNAIILFRAESSTVTFNIESLSEIPDINISVVGCMYHKWGTKSAGQSITFTGLTPGEPYNAKFSCYTGSGTAIIYMLK